MPGGRIGIRCEWMAIAMGVVPGGGEVSVEGGQAGRNPRDIRPEDIPIKFYHPCSVDFEFAGVRQLYAVSKDPNSATDDERDYEKNNNDAVRQALGWLECIEVGSIDMKPSKYKDLNCPLPESTAMLALPAVSL